MSEIKKPIEMSENIHAVINTAEAAQNIHESNDLFDMPRELRQMGQTIAEDRIRSAATELARLGGSIDFEYIDDRLNELEAKSHEPSPEETEKYNNLMQQLLDAFPEKAEFIKDIKIKGEHEIKEGEYGALSEAEAEELTALSSLREAIERPIKVKNLYDLVTEDPEYEDIYPRAEIDVDYGGETNGSKRECVDVDRHLSTKVVDFLKKQPLLKTITLDELFHLIPDDVYPKYISHQQKYNEDNGVNKRDDSLLRGKVGKYIRSTNPTGKVVIDDLAEAGIIIQRGGRQYRGQAGTPLVIFRLLSNRHLTDRTITDTHQGHDFVDEWHQPQITDNFDQEIDIAHELESESASISVEPKELAKKALEQIMITPAIRNALIELLVDRQDSVISNGELCELVEKDPVVKRAVTTGKKDVGSLISLILNPGQSAGRATVSMLENAGIIVERGVIRHETSRANWNNPRVYRMRSAKEQPLDYPYTTVHDEQAVEWENIIGEYKHSQQEDIESTKSVETQDSLVENQEEVKQAEVAIDPALELRIRVARVINYLSENGVLNTTQHANERINVHPEKVPANGHGEQSVKRLLRDLKKTDLLDDDRNVSVRSFILAALQPFYAEVLSSDSAERDEILTVVDQTTADYYDQRRKLKKDAANRRTR